MCGVPDPLAVVRGHVVWQERLRPHTGDAKDASVTQHHLLANLGMASNVQTIAHGRCARTQSSASPDSAAQTCLYPDEVPPDFLNSREDAVLIWAVLILGFCFFKGPREIGGSFLTVLVSVLHPKVLLLFALAGVYCAALILAENKLGLWHTTAIKETVYWFLGTGLALAGNATQATPNTGVWKQTVRRALRATILIEFAVNLYVFPLVVEFVLVFIVLAFIGMQVVAQHDPKIDALTPKVIDGVLIAVGVFLLTSFAAHAIFDLHGFLSRENAERVLVVPAMTLAFIPFVYLVAWYSQRELANLRKQFSL